MPRTDAVIESELRPATETRSESDPRIARSRAAVLDATVSLMVERGVFAVSVDAIVERSGVAKTTVYRHWPTREALVLDAWQSLAVKDPVAAGDRLHEQAAAIALGFAHRIGTRPMSVLLPDLFAAAARDATMERLYEDILRSRRRSMTDVIQAGIRSGELPSGTDADLAASLILGPILYEQLVLRRPPDAATVHRLVGTVLDAAAHELLRRPRTRRPARQHDQQVQHDQQNQPRHQPTPAPRPQRNRA